MIVPFTHSRIRQRTVHYRRLSRRPAAHRPAVTAQFLRRRPEMGREFAVENLESRTMDLRVLGDQTDCLKCGNYCRHFPLTSTRYRESGSPIRAAYSSVNESIARTVRHAMLPLPAWTRRPSIFTNTSHLNVDRIDLKLHDPTGPFYGSIPRDINSARGISIRTLEGISAHKINPGKPEAPCQALPGTAAHGCV
jgi:hypothetical protein